MDSPKSTLLTEKDLKKFSKWIERFPPADLEVLAKILWKRRKEQYEQWDKTIVSYPHKKS